MHLRPRSYYEVARKLVDLFFVEGVYYGSRVDVRPRGSRARATVPSKSIHDHKNPPEEVVADYKSNGTLFPVSILMFV
jgi:hypothetical protein